MGILGWPLRYRSEASLPPQHLAAKGTMHRPTPMSHPLPRYRKLGQPPPPPAAAQLFAAREQASAGQAWAPGAGSVGAWRGKISTADADVDCAGAGQLCAVLCFTPPRRLMLCINRERLNIVSTGTAVYTCTAVPGLGATRTGLINLVECGCGACSQSHLFYKSETLGTAVV
eukprot:SAG31_NODE_5911_length_2259_cov_1.765741_2_plen_172_part_00